VSKTIYISPSTQEHNLGVLDYDTEEKRMNQVADVVCKCLDASKIKYYRNKPEMTLAQVVNDSNSKKVDFHFAIHSNAGKTPNTAQGSEVHIFSKGGDAEKFAKIIYEKISVLTPSADRGIKVSPQLYELKNTNAKTALIEVAFHDSTKDARFIIDNIVQIGVELARGICEFFNEQFINPYASPTPPATNPVAKYRVQIGAFASLDSAKALRDKAIKAGFKDAFVNDK
jgi:N-acetylmuramoyl-L-alanine amidase